MDEPRVDQVCDDDADDAGTEEQPVIFGRYLVVGDEGERGSGDIGIHARIEEGSRTGITDDLLMGEQIRVTTESPCQLLGAPLLGRQCFRQGEKTGKRQKPEQYQHPKYCAPTSDGRDLASEDGAKQRCDRHHGNQCREHLRRAWALIEITDDGA